MENEIYGLRNEQRDLERDIKNMREKHAWLIQFFAKHGIDVEDSSIPF